MEAMPEGMVPLGFYNGHLVIGVRMMKPRFVACTMAEIKDPDKAVIQGFILECQHAMFVCRKCRKILDGL